MSETKKIRVLTAAQDVFLRYGYRRVTMNDIAAAAGLSRPALYLLFRNKEDIFIGVLLKWVDQTVAAARREVAAATTPERQLMCAFEIWAVHPFAMMTTSPEARELIECGFDFAQDALRHGYEQFEAIIVATVASLTGRQPSKRHLAPAQVAHVLTSAVRGFKQVAANPDELRRLIETLLILSFDLHDQVFRD